MTLFEPILQRPIAFAGAVLAAAMLLACPARAEITVSPLRQVLSEADRTVTYRISNPSARIIDGRTRWIDLSATETGYVAAAAETRPGLSAAPYLTVWPAFFRLEPGASETITVALKEGVAPPLGERRSHLVIETAAIRTPLRKAGGAPELDIGTGISTPVLLRGGRGKIAAAIGETRLLRARDGRLEIETHVVPEGDFSAYGRIEISFAPHGDHAHSEPQILKVVENVSAFIDAPRRRVSAPLAVERLPAGVLQIRFLGSAEFEGREFATRAFEIAPPG